jgi:hypothetical protein
LDLTTYPSVLQFVGRIQHHLTDWLAQVPGTRGALFKARDLLRFAAPQAEFHYSHILFSLNPSRCRFPPDPSR